MIMVIDNNENDDDIDMINIIMYDEEKSSVCLSLRANMQHTCCKRIRLIPIQCHVCS